MTLEGKGFFIWKIRNSEAGDANAIASVAQQAGLTHVLIKVANGSLAYNLDPLTGADLVPPVVQALRARNISPWGWHYVYGDEPEKEADIAIRRVRELGLDGYVVDAEAPYKEKGKATAARTFMTRLRASLPNTPLALSSYRYPTLHPTIPWTTFLTYCDYNMPQVYWLGSHNPRAQLIRCIEEFQAITPFRPIIPTGAAFTEAGWSPTPADIIEFLQAAQELDLSAANFYEWANCRLLLPEIWDTIAAYAWGELPQPDIVQQYIDALNSHDSDALAALYAPGAVHVTATRTVQGPERIRAYYENLFDRVLPNAVFNLNGYSGSGNSRFLNWTAISPDAEVLDGNDTMYLNGDKIGYHYSYFTVGQ